MQDITLQISAEEWKSWRESLDDLLSQHSGEGLAVEIEMHVDALQELITKHQYSCPPEELLKKNNDEEKPSKPLAVPHTHQRLVKMKNQSTQLYTIREAMSTGRILRNIKSSFNAFSFSRKIGELGYLVSMLAEDVVKVLALWLTGSTRVLFAPVDSESQHSASSDFVITAEDVLRTPQTHLLPFLHPQTVDAMVAFFPCIRPTLFRPEDHASRASTHIVGLLEFWREGLAHAPRPTPSAPGYGSGSPTAAPDCFVCRVCRREARNLYEFDSIRQRLKRVKTPPTPSDDAVIPAPPRNRAAQGRGKHTEKSSDTPSTVQSSEFLDSSALDPRTLHRPPRASPSEKAKGSKKSHTHPKPRQSVPFQTPLQRSLEKQPRAVGFSKLLPLMVQDKHPESFEGVEPYSL